MNVQLQAGLKLALLTVAIGCSAVGNDRRSSYFGIGTCPGRIFWQNYTWKTWRKVVLDRTERALVPGDNA